MGPSLNDCPQQILTRTFSQFRHSTKRHEGANNDQRKGLVMDLETVREQAQEYVGQGWALVPIPNGQKGPRYKGWNTLENCITKAEQLTKLGPSANIGLSHAYSGTCAIDIDHLEAAAFRLEAENIDLRALLNAEDAVTIDSGRSNRAKLLYRLDEPLQSAKIRHEIDGVSTDIIDFRCSTSEGKTLQDVLPPSNHPDTGKPYQWGGSGDFKELPPLPEALKNLWQRQIDKPTATGQPLPARVYHGDITVLDDLNLSNHTRKLIRTTHACTE